MCGIGGWAARFDRGSRYLSIASALAHRGPDAEGHRACAGEGWSWELAHTRLSIVDLSPAGEQPISNEDGSLVMIFNGEIYNSAELRRYCEAKGHLFSSSMDGEVILHLWEMEGTAALARLNGIFAVVVANTVTGEVVLARDPLGVKPLFYSLDDRNSLWFASELNALAAAGAPLGRHDVAALAQFLSFLWIPDPRTPFEGAKRLGPGEALRWTPAGTRIIPYGEAMVPAVEPRNITPEAAVRDVEERFEEAARRQLMADVPIALMASGGVDSGLVWWAAQDGLDKAYTITWTDDGGVEHLGDDAAAVGQLHERFQTPVQYLPGEEAGDGILPASGDLFADPAFELTRLIARAARADGYKVLMSGQGGDELFAGYRRHAMAPLVERFRLGGVAAGAERMLGRLPTQTLPVEYLARLARASATGDPFRGYMQLCTYSTAPERARALDCAEAEVGDDVVWQRHLEVFEKLPRHISFLRRVMSVDVAVYLPGLGLSYVDRAGMEFGVEVRVPWLDLELARWTLTLPDSVLMRRRRGKWVTRELAARKLSPRIAHRPKRPFGAPATRVATEGRPGGARSFRQGLYFSRARDMLDAFMDPQAVTLGSAQGVRA